MFDYGKPPKLSMTASPQEAAEWCRQALVFLTKYREHTSDSGPDFYAVDFLRRAIRWVEMRDDPEIEMWWGPPPANTSGKRAELELQRLADRLEGVSDPDTPALDNNDLLILQALYDRHPATHLQVDLEDATKLMRRTIGKRLAYMREHGLAERPKGKRQGDRITAKGIRILKRDG